jgi:hypothetical protein
LLARSEALLVETLLVEALLAETKKFSGIERTPTVGKEQRCISRKQQSC